MQLGKVPKMLPWGAGRVHSSRPVSEFQVHQNSLLNCSKHTLCITFLVVFFSYCRYRDSTTFPPVEDIQLVYNKTTTRVCKDPPCTEDPYYLPARAGCYQPFLLNGRNGAATPSFVSDPVLQHPRTCMGHLLCARIFMRHLLYTRTC